MTLEQRQLELLTEISAAQLQLQERLLKVVTLMNAPRASTLKILAKQIQPIESQMGQVKSGVSGVVKELEKIQATTEPTQET